MHLVTRDKDELIKKLRLEIERFAEDNEQMMRRADGVSQPLSLGRRYDHLLTSSAVDRW